MEDFDDDIVALLTELRKHQQDYLYSRFMLLFKLLYERSKEGCLMNEGNQMYRQQGSALAMRDLITALNEQPLPEEE